MKKAESIGLRNEKLARAALQKAAALKDVTALNHAKNNLRLAREVKEANVKAANKKKTAIDSKHAKKIKKELKAQKSTLKAADKKIAASNKTIIHCKAKIDRVKMGKGKNGTIKIAVLRKKMLDALDVKKTAVLTKESSKANILERLTPMQQKMMKGAHKDVNLKIQKNIAKDQGAKVTMIEENITVTTYEMKNIASQIADIKKSGKSELEITKKTAPLVVKKEKLLAAKKSMVVKKKISAKKAANAKSAAARILKGKLGKIYAAEKKIKKLVSQKTKNLEKKVASSKASLEVLRAKVNGAKSEVQKAEMAKELAKSEKAHKQFKSEANLEITTIQETVTSEETNKLVKPEISTTKLKWAVRKVSPTTGLKIVDKVAKDLHQANKIMSKDLKKATVLAESLVPQITEQYVTVTTTITEIQTTETQIIEVEQSGQPETAKAMKADLMEKKKALQVKQSELAKLKSSLSTNENKVKDLKLKKVEHIKKIAENKKVAITTQKKLKTESQKRKQKAQVMLKKNKKSLAKVRVQIKKAKASGAKGSEISKLENSATMFSTSVETQQTTIITSTTEIMETETSIKGSEAENMVRSSWISKESDIASGTKTDWMSGTAEISSMTTMESSTTTTSSSGMNTTEESVTTKTSSSWGRRRMSVLRNDMTITPEQLQMVAGVLGESIDTKTGQLVLRVR